MGTQMERHVGSSARDELTLLLLEWQTGRQGAMDRIMPIVYAELRRLARRQMAREPAGHTLQPTALVNEAYLRLVDLRRMRWQNRAHFFALASTLMRRILVDCARARHSGKRGAGVRAVTLNDQVLVPSGRPTDLVALEDALTSLRAFAPRQERIVELRFFGGLTVDETAEVLGLSRDTILRDWKLAKAWLHRTLARSPKP
jgi:RNA polymerase sigma factor (TIGR02999 family)